MTREEKREAERYRLLFHQNVAGVYEKDLQGTILHCNESFARIFGYDRPDELVGKSAAILYTSQSDRERFLDRLKREGSLTSYELPMQGKDGTPLWVLENAALSHDPHTDQPVIVGTLIDITERKTLETRLERLASQDALTGLGNRRALADRGQQAIALAHRHHKGVAVLFLDLIGFKLINDVHGHPTGDRVLVHVARRLEGVLRDSDTAARVGGDEFVLLLTEVGSIDGALGAGRRILQALRAPVQLDGERVRIKARIGVAYFPEHGATLDELMTRASDVVTRLKDRTESTVELYQPA